MRRCKNEFIRFKTPNNPHTHPANTLAKFEMGNRQIFEKQISEIIEKTKPNKLNLFCISYEIFPDCKLVEILIDKNLYVIKILITHSANKWKKYFII